jgi:hypothetical protein
VRCLIPARVTQLGRNEGAAGIGFGDLKRHFPDFALLYCC